MNLLAKQSYLRGAGGPGGARQQWSARERFLNFVCLFSQPTEKATLSPQVQKTTGEAAIRALALRCYRERYPARQDTPITLN